MSEAQPASFRRRTIEKFDGSTWRQYESPDSLVILTSAGRELISNRALTPILHAYNEDFKANREATTDMRSFMAAGGSARIFNVGDFPIVVKERLPQGDQLLPALERMDKLTYAIESHCPRWIDIPKHYGILVDKHDVGKQYLLIQKIDDGVTVGDILYYGDPEMTHERNRPPHIHESIERMFGTVTPELQIELGSRYYDMKGELRKALLAEYMNPSEYLPDIDYNPFNVVIERLDTPVAGSHYKFWVIDQ